ncbi:E3 ubiquitin-protein ligase ubr1 [Vermiconidia calcicola]|uniref:E3 ubiquitin-protein ligase ubr1 n=1 Tax=Vermiconidia calcicola TaxID=1690605 RepID=A0ACC3MLL5_9PEZI|nr:E3 ubiquitin-protein ligase ubr1 [Vermiconidia calcicola]
MQTLSPEERFLNNELLNHPKAYGNRFEHAAECNLRQLLFRSLARQRQDYLRLFFPNGPPADRSEPWSLRSAQGAIDGAEYTAAAKGTACGHIFKSGESTYHCKTCAADDTCVLCAKCFESSDHEDHSVFISVSPGNSGCCDCGDSEAWKREVKCTIHSADAEMYDASTGKHGAKAKAPVGGLGRDLPIDLVESIRMTIARAVDYLCDVFSCSPEQLRLPKTEASIRQDERLSRLSGVYGEAQPDENVEYCLILWNDEKHTVYDVQNQVARACSQTKKFGFQKAMEVNDIGRSVIYYSSDVGQLLQMAQSIEQLKVTVTIRSSRDTFREHMCATIIDWISDIAGCSVGSDPHILRTVVCEELLKPWRTGSPASNRDVGKEGIDDHEIDDNDKLRRQHRLLVRGPIQPAANVVRIDMAVGDNFNDDDDDDNEDNEDDEDEGFDQMDMEDDDMEIEVDDVQNFANAAVAASNADTDMDVDFLDENEDVTESLEATIAGYPPPPPPPGSGARRRQIFTPAESEDGDPEQVRPESNEPYGNVPKTPKAKGVKPRPLRPSKHWLIKPEGFRGPRPSEPCEDLWQRVRLDFLILYDLRLWKILRINLRHLYITTVVTIPHFKRILGLRFAGLYTALAQLYLIADREPDHSIINLSIQMLTTPTITQEVVERGNFLTNLMAILYTFLTTRQVGFPEDVSPKATLAFDAGAVTNRRMFHFFLDLRWLFQSEFIHYRMRVEPHYLFQFLDLVTLHQGICPNVRATGEHVEYESDAWISASMIIKEINKLCKQVAVSFEPKQNMDCDNVHLQRAVGSVAQVTMINSFGYERKRFRTAELKDDMAWHTVGPFEDSNKSYSVPKHVVQAEPMSFHHPLHYLLSWLIENAKGMRREEMRALLCFSSEDLKDPFNAASRVHSVPNELTSAELLSAIFEHPLRVCVWLAQMKAGMWVRNGITLRHQAHTYRNVSNRDVGYQRDILMLQAGLVLCGSDERPGERFLAQMIDRFQMVGWFKGDYSIVAGFEEAQQLDVIEEFLHFLVIALCERGNLVPSEQGGENFDRVLERDIAHALCFKPLSFSDITNRVTEKVSDSDDFSRVLESMSTFRAPEGMNDTGTFELKPDYIERVDPYYAHYSRNHREEAENIYKKHVGRKLGKDADDVVYEPTLQPITSGLFMHLSAFTATPLFAQVVATALNYAANLRSMQTQMQVTRVETFLHMVLHLVMLAVIEDAEHSRGFVKLAASPQNFMSSSDQQSVVSALVTLTGMDEYASCHPTIKHILRKMQLQQPEKLTKIIGPLGAVLDRAAAGSPASLSGEDKERRKQEALARQARVMAQMKQQQNSFLQNQGLSGLGEDFDDLDDMSITEEPENVEQKKTWNFPTGNCIWCQEETDDQTLYGTFAFLGESNILRSTPVDDLGFIKEVVDTPESLDRPADHIRPFGVAGNNKHIVQKVSPNGKVVEVERQGLSKGFPRQAHEVKGPIANTCGHIMHYSCFELYMANSYRRHTQQIARNHPENIELKEFTCPLCKALGNTFLPIIWKSKDCAPEHELHAAKNFGDWLREADSSSPTDLSFLDMAPTVAYRQQQVQEFSKRSSKYINSMFAPALVAGMNALSLDASPSAQSPQHRYSLRRGYSLTRLFGMGRNDGSQSSIENPGLSPQPDQSPRFTELIKAYQRIDETIRANGLGEPSPFEVGIMNPVTSLSRSLGLTIAAFEISLRGTGNNVLATSLLLDLPEQAICHFRIMSETIESYLAVNVVRPSPINPVARETGKRRDTMNVQLFGLDEEIDMIKLRDIVGSLLFEDDIFLFFMDWLSFMAPSVAEASSVLQLCLWAEVVKAACVYKTKVKQPEVERALQHVCPPKGFSSAFTQAMHGVGGGDGSDPYARIPLSSDQMSLLRQLVEKYALAFLRKAIIAMYVRYGLDFECPYNIDPEMPELQRLTSLLHIPPLDDLCALYCTDNQAGNQLREITRRWISQASMVVEHNQAERTAISLPHPAIFELVGLPKTYDTLTEEAIKRKCPTTGKEITDPAICLFCGDIFCSQAVCCMKDKNKGGCYQHMQKCGGRVGVFLNVRKCMVLFTHGPGNGSFAHAPYLDKHGEPDPTLRRHHQLFLNQRRYDKLMREVWLHHLIPTVISRKLEADINPGGWETL